MHKAHYPKGNVQRLYIKRKEGGRGFISIEEGAVDAVACFTTMSRIVKKGSSPQHGDH